MKHVLNALFVNLRGLAVFGAVAGVCLSSLNASAQISYKDLHDFRPYLYKDAEYPSASVTFDSAGNMFGTASSGYGYGRG